MQHPCYRASTLLTAGSLEGTDGRTVMLDFHHTEDDWLAQVKDRFDVILRESREYGERGHGHSDALAKTASQPAHRGRRPARAALAFMDLVPGTPLNTIPIDFKAACVGPQPEAACQEMVCYRQLHRVGWPPC